MRVDGPRSPLNRYDPRIVLLDPATTAQECVEKELVELAHGGLPKAELARSYGIRKETIYQVPTRRGLRPEFIGAPVASRREHRREE